MKRGFTIIELLVVIGILGAVAAFAIIRLSGAQNSGRDAIRRSDMREYATLLETYANKNNGFYPIQTGSSQPLSNAFCTSLGLSACRYDPDRSISPSNGSNYNYTSNASGTSYVLVAHLEKAKDFSDGSVGPGHYFLCSNGKVKEDVYPNNDPVNGVCP